MMEHDEGDRGIESPEEKEMRHLDTIRVLMRAKKELEAENKMLDARCRASERAERIYKDALIKHGLL